MSLGLVLNIYGILPVSSVPWVQDNQDLVPEALRDVLPIVGCLLVVAETVAGPRGTEAPRLRGLLARNQTTPPQFFIARPSNVHIANREGLEKCKQVKIFLTK